jgi:hypothetical protein
MASWRISMKKYFIGCVISTLFSAGAIAATPQAAVDDAIGRVTISTIPFPEKFILRSATYTPSGKVLVNYRADKSDGDRQVSLAVMDDDGKNMRPFFSGKIPEREKDNGIRFMIFADNKRIFLGDFIIECAPSIDACDRSELLPVEYPKEIADGDHVAHRWSEIIIAPDNEHVSWTTLFSNYSAAVFVGKLEREKAGYRIANSRIVSTIDAFSADPKHADGVIPNTIRNGEVKQFVDGGRAISLVGASNSDLADSMVQDLATDKLVQITHTPGYDETTLFSPDEKLGITMSARFSPQSDLTVLGLMPRPYPAALNMGLNMNAYTYSVTGVRMARSGNVGPALIDLEKSKNSPNYVGVNLNTQDEWVFYSPMSWHPSGKKAMWMEGRRNSGPYFATERRMQVVQLLDYQPKSPVVAKPTPENISYASADLSAGVKALLAQSKDTNVTVYGKHSGQIKYRRTAQGAIEKEYIDFSDDGKNVYRGRETMQVNPRGNSVYVADIKLSGPKPGVMDVKITFGSLFDKLPSKLIFESDVSGVPQTRGYAEYDGKRLNVTDLVR